MTGIGRRLLALSAPRRGMGACRPAIAVGLGVLLLAAGGPAALGQERAPGGDCPPTTPLAGETMTPPERARATATAIARGSETAASACPTEAAEPGRPGGAGSELAPELPPPDLPTANLQGYRFRLEATLVADLDAVPREALVYQLERTPPTAEDVERLAERLGIEAPVEERGEGAFVASGNGQFFASPELVQYFSPEEPALADLPSDEEAVEVARGWLDRSRLVGDEVGEGRVVGRDERAGRIVVLFGPEEPEPLLAAYPSVTVTIGRGGVVLEASARWAKIGDAELYRLRDVEEAWFDVEAARAYIETEFGEADPPPGSEVAGAAAYDAIGLAYTSSGAPGGVQYLQPVYVFAGRLTPEGTEESFPIRAYVPALVFAREPVARQSGGGS